MIEVKNIQLLYDNKDNILTVPELYICRGISPIQLGMLKFNCLFSLRSMVACGDLHSVKSFVKQNLGKVYLANKHGTQDFDTCYIAMITESYSDIDFIYALKEPDND